MSDITRILTAIEQGDAKSTDERLRVVYNELRRMVAHKMANEPAGHTLQPTALVHEAWLKLVDSPAHGARAANAAVLAPSIWMWTNSKSPVPRRTINCSRSTPPSTASPRWNRSKPN